MPIRDAKADLVIMAEQAGLQAKMSVLQKEQNIVRRQIAEIGRRAKTKTLASSDVAKQVNEVVNASLRRLVRSLGAEDFQRLFDWPPGREIILVYPEVAAQVRYGD